MSNPLVSVMMPAYNAMPYLAQAIDSILTQTFTDFELIVVNDGSTDESWEILTSYSDPRISLINNQINIGLVNSLNKTIGLARGKYLARMDADDISQSDRFDLQFRFLEKHPSVAVVGGAIKNIDSNGVVIGSVQQYPCLDADIRDALTRGSPFAHPAVMIRRDAIKELGGYRSAFNAAEDYDLWLRIAERYQLANLSDCLLYYRHHPLSVTNANESAYRSVLATNAARKVAELRSQGIADPTDGCSELSSEILEALGITEEYKAWLRVDSYRARASRLLLYGEFEAVDSVLDEFELADMSINHRNRLIPEVLLLRARLAFKRRNVLRAFGYIILSFMREWRFAGVMIGKVVRQVQRHT